MLFNNCSHVRTDLLTSCFEMLSCIKCLSASDYSLPVSHMAHRIQNHTLEQYVRYFLAVLTRSLVPFLSTHSRLLTSLLASTRRLATRRDSAHSPFCPHRLLVLTSPGLSCSLSPKCKGTVGLEGGVLTRASTRWAPYPARSPRQKDRHAHSPSSL